MKHIYITLVVFALAITSCTNNFTDINTNPNAPVDVEPGLLLRNVLWESSEKLTYEGVVAGGLLAQQVTLIDFNLFDRHELTGVQFGGNPWPTLYRLMRDNEIILDKARTTPSLAHYEGVALVMKTYLAGITTDLFGDVPYSEAAAGKSGVTQPKFDLQADIYKGENGLIDNLDKAILALENVGTTAKLEGDIIYGGNFSAWIKFANSLKIKYLMRMSDVENVNDELQAIYDSGNYITTNTENATFDFTTSQPNNFRMSTARAGDFQVFVMSLTIDEILKDLNDNRLATYFRPTANNSSVYAGSLNGPNTAVTPVNAGDVSFLGTIFRERTGDLDANFMTAHETNFLLAEAAERGFITANAQMLYETAVQQAFDFWLTPMPIDYLTTGKATYGLNGADKLEQIGTQKWIANIANGYESWIDWKRTGFPTLKTISASLNDNLIPVRMPYPATEQALNTDNFNTAAAAANDNSINAKVWWDVN
jgi:hypothetical protein